MVKKRYIILGIALFELASLPAAAKIISEMEYKPKGNVITATIESPPGVQRFFVNSNVPFTITSQDYDGEAQTSIFAAGRIGDVNFGQNARLPGPALACSHTQQGARNIIYQSERSTFETAGGPIEESVLVSIRYDSDENPTFEFVRHDQAKDIQSGTACVKI
ncbi:MAG: hypothetical protein HKN36_05930 [Hellea sp.]|nr:hypothetical protein [Hellea sp.]